MEISEVLNLLRRYANAIADGKVEARAIKNMSDDELAAFDEELASRLQEKQKEAEALANTK